MQPYLQMLLLILHRKSYGVDESEKKKTNLLLINENRLQNKDLHFSLVLFIFCSRKVLGIEKVTALNIFQ